MERVVSRTSILLIDGVVRHSSTKRTSSTLGIGIGCTTTKHKGTSNSCNSNTCNYTSSKTSNKAYWNSTASS